VSVRSLARPAPTATLTYIALLAATSSVLALAPAATGDRLLDALSTNLHQLGRVPLRVLVGSAFWVGGFGAFLTWAFLLAAVAAPVERRIGWRRAAAVFAVGHVGATLLVAAGLFAGVRLGLLPAAVATARDVGASYGFLAVTAVAIRLLPGPPRLLATAGIAIALGLALWSAPSFTAVGHLLAFAIGLACAARLKTSLRPCNDPLTGFSGT
jgi:hypothetical protein